MSEARGEADEIADEAVGILPEELLSHSLLLGEGGSEADEGADSLAQEGTEEPTEPEGSSGPPQGQAQDEASKAEFALSLEQERLWTNAQEAKREIAEFLAKRQVETDQVKMKAIRNAGGQKKRPGSYWPRANQAQEKRGESPGESFILRRDANGEASPPSVAAREASAHRMRPLELMIEPRSSARSGRRGTRETLGAPEGSHRRESVQGEKSGKEGNEPRSIEKRMPASRRREAGREGREAASTREPLEKAAFPLRPPGSRNREGGAEGMDSRRRIKPSGIDRRAGMSMNFGFRGDKERCAMPMAKNDGRRSLWTKE